MVPLVSLYMVFESSFWFCGWKLEVWPFRQIKFTKPYFSVVFFYAVQGDSNFKVCEILK